MGKPMAYQFTDKSNKLPSWLLKEEWDMAIKYMTTSFLGDELLAVETMSINQQNLLVSSIREFGIRLEFKQLKLS
jgi:hypothetical protein